MWLIGATNADSMCRVITWDDGTTPDQVDFDLNLFKVISTPEEAFEYLRDELTRLYLEPDEA